MNARGVLRRLRAEVLERVGAHARARLALDGTAAAILMYHRVLPAAEATALDVEPGMFVTPETFARQLEWLERSFRVLPLADVIACLVAGRSLPRGACAITFDDGWRDNHVHALPLLGARRLPATIFLVTGRVGTRGAFWPDEACRRFARVPSRERAALARELGLSVAGDTPAQLVAALKPLGEEERARRLEALRARTPAVVEPERELLDWEEIGQMARAGIAFESHGVSHAILPGLPDDAVARELGRARSALAERGLGQGGLLAYPSGAFDGRVKALAHDAGYLAAVTTQRRIARRADDAFALPRIGLHQDVSASRAEFHRLVPGDR